MEAIALIFVGDDWAEDHDDIHLIDADGAGVVATTATRCGVYVPLGTQWYGYVVRRSGERPAHLTFFLGALAEREPQEPRPPGRRELR